jgi:hypothetical protein
MKLALDLKIHSGWIINENIHLFRRIKKQRDRASVKRQRNLCFLFSFLQKKQHVFNNFFTVSGWTYPNLSEYITKIIKIIKWWRELSVDDCVVINIFYCMRLERDEAPNIMSKWREEAKHFFHHFIFSCEVLLFVLGS